MNRHFKELEEGIMGCWGIINDMRAVGDKYSNTNRPLTESDAANLVDLLNGLSVLYEVKFEKLWEHFNEYRK